MVAMAPLLSLVCLVVISLSAAQETTVVPGCYIRQADIVFLLDSSNSEGAANFEKQKDFVSTFANSLIIGPDDIQISVVTFESDIHNQFNLDTYENKTDLLDAIKNISFVAGNTLTEKALNFVRTVSFTNSSGDRANVEDILVVLTDGHSTDRNSTLDEAEMLHNTSTKVITIGIGADIDISELNAIASDPSNAFTVPDFDALAGIQNSISAQACVVFVPTTTPEPTTTSTTTEPPCFNRVADIVFLLDSSNSEGAQNFELQKDFVRNFVTKFVPKLGTDGVQISAVTFESNVHNAFDLNEYENATDILEAIRNITFTPGNTLTDNALKFVREHSFTNTSGDRPEANNILVVLTDGQSTDRNQTDIEANALHNTDTKVITIGIGAGVDVTELNEIASQSGLVFTVPDFKALSTIESQIGRSACATQPPTTTTTTTTTTTPTTTTTTTTTTTPGIFNILIQFGYILTAACNVTRADIVFLLDTSNSLGQVNFDRQIRFVLDVVNALDIGPDGTQVAITTFQTDIYNVFQLKDFGNKVDMENEIRNIRFTPGNTFTDKALRYARDVMFQPENGDRPDVRNVLILMTDGQSSDQNGTMKQAEEIHNTTKIDVITIGVGNLIDNAELLAIASKPSYDLSVDDYSELNSILAELGLQTTGCIITLPPTTSTTTMITTTAPTTPVPVDLDCNKTVADVLFLVDSSSSVNSVKFQQEKDLISEIVQQLPISPDDVQIAFATYSSEVHSSFFLNQWYNVSEIVNEISQTVQTSSPGVSMPRLGLEFAEEVFKPINGDRQNATDIVLVISNGDSIYASNADNVVQRLQNRNVTIITFASENSTELQNIASPSFSIQDENITTVGLPSQIKGMIDQISGFVPCPTTTPVPTTTPSTTLTTITTTTTPPPTTTVTPACSKIVADVLFLVDSSNSVTDERFETEKNFTSQVIQQFTIGPDDVQIAYLTFETLVHSQFQFNTFNNSADVLAAVQATSYTPGNTYTNVALQYAREQVFTPQNGDRANVSNIVVLMSDGESTFPEKTSNEADLIKANNVTIVTFAISDAADTTGLTELQEIASPTFAVNTSFTGLISKVTGLADVISGLSLCPPTAPPTKNPCFAPEADIVFLMDSSNSLGPENWEKEKQFVMDLIDNLNVGPNDMQVSVVTFESNPTVQFYLNDYQNKYDAIAAISNITFNTGNTLTGKALEFVNDFVFVENAGDRPNANNILVVLTDGKSIDTNETLEQAASLKNDSVKIFAIGVGLDDNGKSELESIATDQNHVFQTSDFFTLSSLQSEIELTEIDCNSTTLPPITTIPTTTPTTTPTPDCDQRRADIIFVLDSSNSEGLVNFNRQLDFVKNFVKLVKIGPNNVQIGVVTFESEEHNEFDLNEHLNSKDLISAIDGITYKPGNTFTGKALALVNNHSLTAAAGNRPNANDIVIVMTDGQSTDRNETLEEAAMLKSSYPDLDTFAIGIGAGVDNEELAAIASDSSNVFHAPNFQFISDILPLLGNSTCLPPETTGTATTTTIEPAPTTSTENPRTTAPITAPTVPSLPIHCAYKKVDMVFLLDTSNSEGPSNFAIQKNFVYNVAQNFDIGLDRVRVGLVTFASNVFNQFNLSTYDNRAEVLEAISKVPFTPGNTITEAALKFVREESFTPEAGDRPDVGNVLVVLTDGQSTDKNETIAEAEFLHNTSTKVISIGIGAGVDASEISQIASDPKLAYTVADFNALKGIQVEVEKSACVDAIVCEDEEDCESMGPAICMRFDGWARKKCAKYCGYCKKPQ
ncbi:collagen alpha-3(VI) chain-like [Pecten maximus]|uniref:collagen alpha-3(VI) chain-like n=1 Tax=Pecten maximus TaxID=6579 RepID=UPI0014581A36|nr:collagen alpha-3(VI) chain-like [Pecten maximus]